MSPLLVLTGTEMSSREACRESHIETNSKPHSHTLHEEALSGDLLRTAK